MYVESHLEPCKIRQRSHGVNLKAILHLKQTSEVHLSDLFGALSCVVGKP
jgi:hypothetical protein